MSSCRERSPITARDPCRAPRGWTPPPPPKPLRKWRREGDVRPPLAATRIRGRTAEPRASWLHWASRLAACTHQQAISDTRRAIISRVWKAVASQRRGFTARGGPATRLPSNHDPTPHRLIRAVVVRARTPQLPLKALPRHVPPCDLFQKRCRFPKEHGAKRGRRCFQ